MSAPGVKLRDLVCTKNGHRTMVHRGTCHMAQRGNAQEWDWANHVPEAQAYLIRDHCRNWGYRTCSRCKPLAVY